MHDRLSTFLQDKEFAGRILSAWNKLLLASARCGERNEKQVFLSAQLQEKKN
jgi:hypothetical protein